MKYFFQHEKRNLVSPSDHVMFYLLYKHQLNTKSFYLNSFFWSKRCGLLGSHSNGDIFTCEDNVLFSHVKMSSFHAKAHLVFHNVYITISITCHNSAIIIIAITNITIIIIINMIIIMQSLPLPSSSSSFILNIPVVT